MGTWCSCVECIGDQPEPTDAEFFASWFDAKEAEYRMMGLPEKEAKEKAMSDWHTYAPNGVGQEPRIARSPAPEC